MLRGASNFESRLAEKIDLERVLGKLGDFHLSLLIARNVVGMTWTEVSEFTGWSEDKCQRGYRDCSLALALWLRSYYGHAGQTPFLKSLQVADRKLR